MNHFAFLAKIATDIRIALALSTILPVGPQAPVNDGEIARTSWALPVAGLLVGLGGAAIYSVARMTGLTAGPAAMLAVTATVLITGAIHEDGSPIPPMGSAAAGTSDASSISCGQPDRHLAPAPLSYRSRCDGARWRRSASRDRLRQPFRFRMQRPAARCRCSCGWSRRRDQTGFRREPDSHQGKAQSSLWVWGCFA
jgi:hypothetical protein